jgi:hypothetical protein
MTIKKTNKTYFDVTNQRLDNSSMLRMFNVCNDEENTMFLNIFRSFIIDDTIMDDSNNVEKIGILSPWWENLSDTYYGDVNSWWVVPLANDVLNPFEGVDEGDIITVLKKPLIPFIQRDMARIFEQ